MRTLWIALAVTAAVLAALGGGIRALSESGEVVVLETVRPDGGTRRTRLWVVDDGHHAWLRAGRPQSPWLADLRARPLVSVTRGGSTERRRAVAVDDAAARARVNALMARKYGLPDRIIGLLLRDADAVTPIRLEPAAGS